MFQWFLPVKEQKQIYTNPTLLYFANSAAGTMFLPPRMMHAHEDRTEITFVSGGSGTYIIDNHRYKVKKGDIIIVEPSRIHDEKKDSDSDLSVLCIGITGVHMAGFGRNQILPDGAVPVLHSGEMETHIENLLLCMFEQLLLKTQKEAISVCSHLLEALIWLIREIPVEYESSNKLETDINYVRHIKTYLDEHYNERYSLDEMAEQLNMSTSYLAHTFKDTTGYSPGQYMIWRRIGEAQTLLCITKYPVTQVATMVGYDNTNYFSSLFKKIVEMKPKEYRDYWHGKEKGGF